MDATSGDDGREGASWAESVATIGRALVLARGTAGPDTIRVSAGTYVGTYNPPVGPPPAAVPSQRSVFPTARGAPPPHRPARSIT